MIFQLTRKTGMATLLAISILLMSVGCNSDIFMESTDSGQYLTASVDGDGGSAVFRIPFAGLVDVSFEMTSEAREFCSYYNHRGQPIDTVPSFSNVGKIIFDNDRIREVLTIGDGIVTYTSESNSIGVRKREIRLEYDYGVRYVMIDVGAGRPMELSEVVYDLPLRITEPSQVKTRRTTFRNNGHLPQNVVIRPWLQEQGSIMVEPVGSPWVHFERLVMDVPVYRDGGWTFEPVRDLTPGNRYSFVRPDRMSEVDVVVGPESNVNIMTDVTYSMAEAGGTMVYRNHVLDRTVLIPFECQSTYPVSYEIRVENIE